MCRSWRARISGCWVVPEFATRFSDGCPLRMFICFVCYILWHKSVPSEAVLELLKKTFSKSCAKGAFLMYSSDIQFALSRRSLRTRLVCRSLSVCSAGARARTAVVKRHPILSRLPGYYALILRESTATATYSVASSICSLFYFRSTL